MTIVLFCSALGLAMATFALGFLGSLAVENGAPPRAKALNFAAAACATFALMALGGWIVSLIR